MEVVVFDSKRKVAERGAELVARVLRVRPSAVLGLATGKTPIRLYRRLIQKCRDGELSFREVTTFNLDEYLGIEPDDPQSYRSYMEREFFSKVDIDRAKTHIPGCPPGDNPKRVGPLYEEQIRLAGGIDLQILGIGQNGHIGFNEPSSSLNSRTRVKTLAGKTVEDNSKLLAAGEFQPRLAITMGIATIMQARRILLLATGSKKSAAVAQMVEGPVTAMCPASILQMHEHVTVLVDEAAAADLQNRAYYDLTFRENEALDERFGAFYADS